MTKRYDKVYWQEMAERYFEAETSDSEEQLLKCFLASEEGQDEAFDEVRAVMGVFAIGRRTTKQRTTKPVVWIWSAIAAAVVGVVFILTTVHFRSDSSDICVAYVDGQEITDRREVLAMMHSSWENVGYSESPSVEKQLEDLFSTLP